MCQAIKLTGKLLAESSALAQMHAASAHETQAPPPCCAALRAHALGKFSFAQIAREKASPPARAPAPSPTPPHKPKSCSSRGQRSTHVCAYALILQRHTSEKSPAAHELEPVLLRRRELARHSQSNALADLKRQLDPSFSLSLSLSPTHLC